MFEVRADATVVTGDILVRAGSDGTGLFISRGKEPKIVAVCSRNLRGRSGTLRAMAMCTLVVRILGRS